MKERWIDRTDGDSPAAQAGALLRHAVQKQPVEASRLAAIRARVRVRRDGWRPQRHWALRLAIAVGLLLSGGALTAAGQRYLHLFAPSKPAAPGEVGAPTPRLCAPRARIAARAPTPTFAPEPPAEMPPPAETPSPAPLAEMPPPAPPVRTAARIDPPAAPEPPPAWRPSPAAVSPAPFDQPAAPPLAFAGAEPHSSALARESTLLAEALRKLRQEDDAGGALGLLDEHDVLFGAGAALAPEATLARIEALIRTHRNSDALAVLDQTIPDPRGSGRDLLIARAELRAAAGRCPAAVSDFDRLLRRDAAADSTTERALWGRAACRAAGDADGARRDLKSYLARFPDGRFADQARATLGK